MTFYVNTPNQGTLNMREKPNTKSLTLYKIPNGIALEGEADGDWARVSYKGETGYVMMKFLSTEVQPSNSITQEDLQKVYNGLKDVIKTIENILKRGN